MDSHFYQMVEHVLREELAAAFHEAPEDAGKCLAAAILCKQDFIMRKFCTRPCLLLTKQDLVLEWLYIQRCRYIFL